VTPTIRMTPKLRNILSRLPDVSRSGKAGALGARFADAPPGKRTPGMFRASVAVAGGQLDTAT
jgi:hypothetical protein